MSVGSPQSPPTSHTASLAGRTRHAVPVILAALALSALAIFAAARFSRQSPRRTPPPPGMKVGEQDIRLSSDAAQWSVLRLGKVDPAVARWTDPVIARVRIDEAKAARIGLPLEGRVMSVYVELGEHVKKGQPLLSVISADLATLHSDVQQAAVDVEVASANYQRVHDMVLARITAGKDELTAAAQKKEAELRLQTARAKLHALKVDSRHANEFMVRSPRDGVVVEKNVLPSQEVSADQTLMQIADVGNVWVLADVFESDAIGVHAGTPVKITLPSLPGYLVETVVDSISAVVDPERHSVPVKVRLTNTEGKLRPNEYADMSFRVEMPADAVEVPETSLVSDGATQYVYVQQSPGHFARRTVIAGPVRDRKVAITHGLQAGETIVVQGGILLDNQIVISH